MNHYLIPNDNQAHFSFINSSHLLIGRLALPSPVVCLSHLQSSFTQHRIDYPNIVLANTGLKTLLLWGVNIVWFHLGVYFRNSLSCFGTMSCAQLKFTAAHSSQKAFLNIYAYTLEQENIHVIKPQVPVLLIYFKRIAWIRVEVTPLELMSSFGQVWLSVCRVGRT